MCQKSVFDKARRLVALMSLLLLPMATYAQGDLLDKTFDFDHCVAYVVAALWISVFVLLFYNRLYMYRVQEVNEGKSSQNDRLALILQTGNLNIWLYVPQTRHYIVLSEKGEYESECNPLEFSRRFDRSDFDVLQAAIFDICDGLRLSSACNMKSPAAADGSQRYYDINVTIFDRDEKGQITQLLGIQHDVTDEVLNMQHVNELLMRYHTVFNSALLDMLYYDNKGVLKDINEKACQAFGVKDRDMVLQDNFVLENNPFFEKIELQQMQNVRTSSIVDFADYGDERYRIDEFGLHGKMYYESAINPIRDAQGELEGVYMSGRDITEMVESFHRQQQGAIMLSKVTKSVQDYIQNINYALRVSDVRMLNYYPQSYTLELSNNVNQTQMRLSQLRCIRLASPRFRRNVSSVLNRMDHHTAYTITETIETELRDKKGRQIWLMFNMVPMLDQNGQVERYFGMCRDVTETIETEHKLAIETKKAQETELLKQAFLTNMSYEIRTPLNTVVGFAELFESEHDTADEAFFVEQIKTNSNTLLALINDILFLSRLDANMVEYNKVEVDFAQIFESHCQMGWSRVNPNVKTVIENPYEHLVVKIDQGNLGKVIENLCATAVLFTTEGRISAKYEYWSGELIITIADTGVGIDEETLPHVFDRFVRNKNQELCGTGLALPIVQTLVQQMGGNVVLYSELGKGTTVRVTMPAEATVVETRRDDGKTDDLSEKLLMMI